MSNSVVPGLPKAKLTSADWLAWQRRAVFRRRLEARAGKAVEPKHSVSAKRPGIAAISNTIDIAGQALLAGNLPGMASGLDVSTGVNTGWNYDTTTWAPHGSGAEAEGANAKREPIFARA